jgi:hypothetical protein
VTRVPAVDGIMRHHKLWRPDRIAERSRSKNGSQSSKRGWSVLMPADYPPPIPRRQIRPGINNSTAPAPQLITIAVGDRSPRAMTMAVHPLVVFWSAYPGLQQKIDQATRRAGAPRSQTVRLHGYILDFSPPAAALRMPTVECS